MPNDHYALVNSSSIVVYDQQHNSIAHSIHLASKYHPITSNIVFSSNHFFLESNGQQKCILSIQNDHQAKPIQIYDFLESKKNKLEWSPKLMLFEGSQRLILQRRYYAESNVLVIDSMNANKITWDLNLQSECLNKLDDDRYLVFYRQKNKHSMEINVLDVQNNSRNSYCICQQIEPSICKAIKLMESFSEGITVLMLINTKFNGFRAYSIDLLHNSDHYAIKSVCSFQSQIEQLLACDSNSFVTLQYSLLQNQLHLCLTTYKVSTEMKSMLEMDRVPISNCFEGYDWSDNANAFVTF